MTAEHATVWGLVAALACAALTDRLCLTPRSGPVRAMTSAAVASLAGWLVVVTVSRFSNTFIVAAFAYLAVIGVAASCVDVAERRLPHELIIPGYLVVAAFLIVKAATTGDGHTLARAAVAGALSFVFHLLLALTSRGGLGAGDVKFAGLLGLALGWLGWSSVLTGVLIAWVAAAAAVGLRRLTSKSPMIVTMGPFMLVGFEVAALTAV